MAILRRPEHFWPILWAGVVAALGAIVALEHFLGRVAIGEGTRAPAKIVEARLQPPFTLPPEDQLAPETTARPLLVPTRRPSPAATAAAPSTIKRGQFVLTGVSVTPEAAFAFLKEVSTGKTLSVRKGAAVNELTVETVEPRRVVLRQGEEIEDLTLNVQVPARVAVAPAPTAAIPPAPGAAPVPRAIPVAPPGLPNQAPPASGAPVPIAQPVPAAPGVAPPSVGRRRPWINAQ